PNHNTLFIMPSAETNPKGSSYLSNYELLYMNVGHSFSDDLHVSLGFLFPITSEFISHGPMTLGLKQRLLCEPEKYNVSLMGSYTFALAEDYSLITFGGAINYYTSPDFTFNFYLGDMLDPKANEINHLINFGVGITARTGESTKLIVEYLNGQIEDEIFDGIFLVGVRFFGKKLSVDLAGLAPLTGGEWFLWPFLNFTYHF
ncbi:MAG: hypothetical protein KAS62_07710, partial [Candidatus Delongbacteria bacterium]|nr:hypothetical protein [Candidatus Delongbacteria bacterium]